MFNSAFRFDERLRSLDTTFSEYRQTNSFVDAVSMIPESVNATLEAEVLTRSSHSSRTSYAIAADLSKMELKKILIEKMEGNNESAFAEEPIQTTCQMEEPLHPVFETGDAQSWISDLARQTDARSSFNELLDTSIDFSNFIMNRFGVATLTPELLAGPTYELMRGLCNSLTELEYHLEEVYKASTDQLDWVNPE
nr:hypothetical protein [Tanacetum cinerariifolium]